MAKLSMGVNFKTGLLLLTLTLAKCQDYTILEDDDFGYWDRIEDTDVQAQQLLESLCNNYDMKVNGQWIDCSSIQLTSKTTFWDVNDELLVNHKLEKREVEEELTEGSGNGIITLVPLGDPPKEGDDASPIVDASPAGSAEAKEPTEEVAAQENVGVVPLVEDEGNKEAIPADPEQPAELEDAAGKPMSEEPAPIPPVDSVPGDAAQPGAFAASVDQTEDSKPTLPSDAVRAPVSNGDNTSVEIPSAPVVSAAAPDSTKDNIVPADEDKPLKPEQNPENPPDPSGADIPVDTHSVNGELNSVETDQDGAKESESDDANNLDKPSSEGTVKIEGEESIPEGVKNDDPQPIVEETDKEPTQSEDTQKPIPAFTVASLDTQKNKENKPRSETTLAPPVDESNKATTTSVDKPKESEKLDDKQSGNSVLTQEPNNSDSSTVEGRDTAKQLSALSESSETNGSSEQPKTAESAKDVSSRGKDATVLIVLFVVVLVIGAAAFTHHFIKKRRANNESSSINGITKDLESPKNGDVEQGVEMKPLLNSNNKPVIVKEFSDTKNDETA